MPNPPSIDPYKLMHWLNARKLTPEHVRDHTGIALDLHPDSAEESLDLSGAEILKLAELLDVPVDELAVGPARQPAVLFQSRAETAATRRAVQRDGIHFYNYYSLPAPSGHIAPVVLDILCPEGQLPKLNNGHLEPAITVNIGPGDIHGRWGEEINDLTWAVLKANRNSEHAWIVGDSYLEPSYRPHSYSLAGQEPARIISYTCKSNLHALLTRANEWTDASYDRFVEDWSGEGQAALLGVSLRRRAHTARSLAAATGIPEQKIAACLSGDRDALGVTELRRIGPALGVDHRLLLPAEPVHDEIGKTWCSVEDGIASIREFGAYRAASMAGAPQLPDIVGLYLAVDRDDTCSLDLFDHGASHYLATLGTPTAWWTDENGAMHKQALAPDDSLWVGPCVPHGFSGEGALIKLGNGEGYGYLEHLELTQTVRRPQTLRRARRDSANWGYEPTTAN
ncbi:histidine kinase [Streptomyces chrestomyceticus]|uniref:histidine kinase n=1 Tax=Streptomyces chrestomyceticus TaxID=68185 RepID=UPI0019D248E5|nr:histidine kinase [Streptomyces chrestomyceticus]